MISADLGRFSHTYILSLLTHFQPEMSMKNGQIPPNSLTRSYWLMLIHPMPGYVAPRCKNNILGEALNSLILIVHLKNKLCYIYIFGSGITVINTIHMAIISTLNSIIKPHHFCHKHTKANSSIEWRNFLICIKGPLNMDVDVSSQTKHRRERSSWTCSLS